MAHALQHETVVTQSESRRLVIQNMHVDAGGFAQR